MTIPKQTQWPSPSDSQKMLCSFDGTGDTLEEVKTIGTENKLRLLGCEATVLEFVPAASWPHVFLKIYESVCNKKEFYYAELCPNYKMKRTIIRE